MSSSDADQVMNLLLDCVESSCVARISANHHRWAIPRATATRRLRGSLIGQLHRAPVGDLLLTSLLSGSVMMKTSVSQLTPTGVQFTDGTYVDNVDTIICATGLLPVSSVSIGARREEQGRGHTGTCPQNWGNIFFGQSSCKIRALSGKYRKIRIFCYM